MTELINNIYKVVTEGAEVSEQQAANFGNSVAEIITERLAKTGDKREFTLRMSNIGKGARQLWYDKRYGSGENLPPQTHIKFMFGDIIEQLVLFLAEVAGHNVSKQQTEVELDGIKGHIDAEIDGVTVDVKSASTHSFRKFADGSLAENDPFGYVEQLSGYCQARDTDGAFIAVDKQNGHITYLPIERLNVSDRIAYLKDAMDSDEPPSRCHSDEPEGKSGNMALGVNCSYCVSLGTKVLKSNLTWSNIEDLNLRDSIIGFRETDQLKLDHTTVENIEFINLPSFKVNTNKGSIIVSSDHMFMARTGNKGIFKWVKACDLTPDYQIKYFGDPWTQPNDKDISYLSGFLDGEGCWSNHKLSWAQRPGPVADFVLSLMSKYGFDTPQRYVKNNSDCLMWRVGKDAYSSFKAVGQIRPIRLLPKAIKDIAGFRVKNSTKDHAKVISIYYLGNMELVSVKTSLNTLLTDGYYSHNCSHKFRCWSDSNNGMGLRIFNYSSGPKFLTKVVVEPRVQELFGQKQDEDNSQ